MEDKQPAHRRLIRRETGRENALKTALTALVSAAIGGLVAALFLLVGLSGSLNGGSGTGNVTIKQAPASPGSSGAKSGAGGLSAGDVYRRDAAGVVSVDVASSKTGPAGGSGFVLDEAGHIITNQHVVSGANDISVRFAGGAREAAKVVGQDPSTDVAVIKVDAPKGLLKPLTLGDSSAVGVGEPVVAIGNPLNVGISVTSGIVSGKGRPIEAPNNYTIDNAVQTDAAISSGNSGGPLLDSRGAVIGVNSQVASAGSSGVAQGVGFAVPINTVKNVVEQLVTTGKVVHGFIGVSMFTYGTDEISAYTGIQPDELKRRYGLPPHGAIVSGVAPGGPADKAGIRGGKGQEIGGISGIPVGDVITQIQGKKVSSSEDVIRVVNASKPGDKLALTVVTPKKGERKVEVTVGSRPEGA